MRLSPNGDSADPQQAPARFGQALQALWPGIKDFPLAVALGLVVLVLGKLAAVSLPLLLQKLVDGLDSQAGRLTVAMALPWVLLGGYGLLRFANTLLSELRDVLFGRVAERAMRHAARRVFTHLHALDLDFHLSRKSGQLAREIERGVDGIGFLLRLMLGTVLPTLLELLLVAGILWQRYELSFALIALVAVLLYVGLSVRVTDWRTGFVKSSNQKDAEANGLALDSLLNFETVKYFHAEAREAERYDQALAQYESAAARTRSSLGMLNGGQALIIALGLTAMTALAALRVGQGQMSVGDFVAVNAFMAQLFLPLNVLGFVYREIRRGLTDMGRLFGLLALTPRIASPAAPQPLPEGPLDLRIEDVHFGYRADVPVLRGISLHIPAGQTWAVVGASGAGKSTLTRLLFRFYDPQQGSVRVGGVPLPQLGLGALRESLGVVPQDVVLLNASLADNLRFAAPDAPEATLWRALEAAQLGDFVRRQPDGLATMVGERGLKLSGGEKQRLAIARVLLKPSRILVFDEATSALDTLAEAAVQAALRAQDGPPRTVLKIAHRLSTVVDADGIVVLDHGRVAECGTHAALLARGGLYAQLWAAQARESA